jgi:hypothetical protein
MAARALHEAAGGHMMAVASSPIFAGTTSRRNEIHEKTTFDWDAFCSFSRSHAGRAAG